MEDEGKQLLLTSILTLGNDYVEISRESNNLFELPDLRHLLGDKRKERLDDFQSFLESALLTMIVGLGANSSVMI